MRKIILPLFLLASPLIMGQIIITKTDLPQAGQEYLRSKASNMNVIDLNIDGANTTWDYTNLQRASRDTMIYQKVLNTPLAYQFMFSNPLTPEYLATEGKWSEDRDIGGGVTMTDNYLFSKQTSSAWEEIGIGTTVSGIPLPTKYSDIKTKLKLPLGFGDVFTDTYSYLVQIPAIGVSGQDGVLDYTVDAWGTMKLPGGTYDVLRVKTQVQKSDTIYLDALGFGLRIPSTETIYEWYAKGEGYPVLTVTTTMFDVITSVLFSDDLVNGVARIDKDIELKVFPNPAIDVVNIKFEHTDYQVVILDVSGNTVSQSVQNSPKQIDVSNLPGGVYFIRVINRENSVTQRFVKR